MPELWRSLQDSWLANWPTTRELAASLLLAFALASPVAWCYIRTHRGMSYSRVFAQSLVLLAMIVALVMQAIGDSLARAFGLFGALALIRFRTPIKDVRDATWLFLAVGVGITTGIGNTALAVVGTGLALLVALYLDKIGFGSRQSHDGVLRLWLPADRERESRLREVLGHYCRSFALLQLREGRADGEFEFAWQLRLRDAEAVAALVTDVRAIPGAQDVSVLVQDEHQEI